MSGSETHPVPRRRSTPRSADVIVIGGGIVGTSCAAYLAATGRRVVLIERTDIAAGASGRNSGVVQHPFDSVLVDLHLETVRLYRDLARTVQGEFALPSEPAGLLLVSPDAELARRLAEGLSVSHPGLAPTFLDPDAAHAVEPALARGIAACRLAMGYPVAPAAATRAYASWATRLGVGIRLGEDARPRLARGGSSVSNWRTVSGSTRTRSWSPLGPGPQS